MFEYLVFRLGYSLSKYLPFSILYKLSDFLFFVLYYIVGYRKKVVFYNLHRSFPDFDKKKIQSIAKKYYKHLADLFLETLKFFTLDQKELEKRFIVENAQEVNKYYYLEKNIIMSGAHLGNWELGALAAPYWSKYQIIILYKPIQNKYINEFIKRKRSKHGARLISIDITGRSFVQGSKPYCVIMISDQNPSNPNKAFWVNFFGIRTATLYGIEIYARRYNTPVLFFDMKKIKRGYYKVHISTIVENPKAYPKGYITWKYMKKVEEAIKENPQLWIWSHKRWKHKFDPKQYKLYDFSTTDF